MTIECDEAARIVARLRDGAPVVGGPGWVSGALYACGYDPATLYNMELGYATSMALGLALATPTQRVLSFEGDGSLVAELGVLATVNRYRPENLVVVVMDNGQYASTADGLQQTVTSTGTDLVLVARACGLDSRQAHRVDTAAAFEAALRTALAEPGPWVIVCDVPPAADASHLERLPRPQHDVVESAVFFKREMLDRGFGPGHGTSGG